MSFSLVDVICILIMLVFAIIATAKGFIKAIFGKLCWILGLVFAFLFYAKLSVYIQKSLVKNVVAANIIAFILIFIVVFLIVKIIQVILSKIFEGEIMQGLDRTLGFVFGLVEGLAIIFLIIFILETVPAFANIKNTIAEGSFFYKQLSKLLPTAQQLINETKEATSV